VYCQLPVVTGEQLWYKAARLYHRCANIIYQSQPLM
jgi:hypothetical protein